MRLQTTGDDPSPVHDAVVRERVSSPDHSGSSLGRGLDQSLKRKRERKRDELEAVHVADLRR